MLKAMLAVAMKNLESKKYVRFIRTTKKRAHHPAANARPSPKVLPTVRHLTVFEHFSGIERLSSTRTPA